MQIANPALSRVQCRLDYLQDEWCLTDGDGSKRSTNGTWYYVEEPFEVYNNMIFKAGFLVFRAYLHP